MVLQHGAEDIAAVSGEADECGVAFLAFGSFAGVIRAAGGVSRAAKAERNTSMNLQPRHFGIILTTRSSPAFPVWVRPPVPESWQKSATTAAASSRLADSNASQGPHLSPGRRVARSRSLIVMERTIGSRLWGLPGPSPPSRGRARSRTTTTGAERAGIGVLRRCATSSTGSGVSSITAFTPAEPTTHRERSLLHSRWGTGCCLTLYGDWRSISGPSTTPHPATPPPDH